MAFTLESNKVPTSIGDISISITDFLTDQDTIDFSVQIKDAEGQIFKVKSGNLAPHLSAQQISDLQAIAADVRVKAQALIP